MDYYVDPSALVNGNGSINSPFNSWESVVFNAGDTYRQKCGTTYFGKVTVNAAVELSNYGFGPIPKINGAGQDKCINITATGAAVVQYELFGPDSGITRRCLSFNADDITLDGLIIHDPVATTTDVNGISGVGDNVTIKNSSIYNIPSDGIWAQGNNLVITDNTIVNVATDGRLSGDGIQLYGNATRSCSNAYIARNIIDHTSQPCKQGITVQDTTSGAGCIIEDNVITGPYNLNFSPILVEIPGSIVRRNRVSGGAFGIIAQGGRTGSNGAGRNCLINSNIVANALTAGIAQWDDTHGAVVLNNTVVSCAKGIFINNKDEIVKNNIVLNCGVGISMLSGAGEDKNCYYGNGTNVVSINSPAFGVNSVFQNPRVTNNGIITSKSVCKSGGELFDLLDITGKPFSKTKHAIGAYSPITSRIFA